LAGHDGSRFNNDKIRDYWKPGGPDFDGLEFLKSFGPVITGYGSQINLFPVYTELKKQTNSEMVGVYSLATTLIAAIYLVFGILAIYMFGSAVEPNILLNVGNECSDPKLTCPWETYVL